MANAKLITNTGLTIRAKTIAVDQGGTIQANPAGSGTPGDGGNASPSYYGGCGGGYGAAGGYPQLRCELLVRSAPRSARPPTRLSSRGGKGGASSSAPPVASAVACCS